MLSHLRHDRLCKTLNCSPVQAPLSMEFSKQDYWSGLPGIPLGDLPNLEIKHISLMSPALAGVFFSTAPLILQKSESTFQIVIKL